MGWRTWLLLLLLLSVTRQASAVPASTMNLAPGIDEVAARTCVALVLRHVRQKRKIRLAALTKLDDDESEVEHARSVLRRKRRLA